MQATEPTDKANLISCASIYRKQIRFASPPSLCLCEKDTRLIMLLFEEKATRKTSRENDISSTRRSSLVSATMIQVLTFYRPH